jgi:hypothetical protein
MTTVVRTLWIFLTGLLQLAGCTRFLSLPLEDVHAVRTVAVDAAGVRHAVAAGDDLVAVFGPADTESPRTFLRIHGQTNETLSVLPEEWSWCGLRSEQLIAREDASWWYSRCAGGQDQLFIRVVSSAGSSAPATPAAIPIRRPPTSARGWLPMEGKELAGVLLSTLDHDERTLRADLVTAAGVKELGVVQRTDPATIGADTWQAHRLDDDRVALVSIDFDQRRDTSMVLLRVIAGGQVTESRLPFTRQNRYVALASTLDTSGRLAVVAVSKRAVEAMIIDPRQPSSARARPLAEASGPAGFPACVRVVATGRRFVAAWLRSSDRAINLCEFDEPFTFPAMAAGGAVEGDVPLLELRRRTDGIDVLWSTGGGVAWRRLPDQPTGYLIAADLWIWLRTHSSSSQQSSGKERSNS